ncbi:MAG: hypothetical protein KJ600_01600 [Nanoarchaeota archaeon]|nr:hypothetical protein [Nanoarchaeota archaeon]MBU1103234.1 hypothetical protein [Nanoarchaeota archaeon]
MDEKMKGGQATMWIVLAIVLLASVILFFLLSGDVKIIKPSTGDAPFEIQTFLESCASTSVSEAVDIMLPHGGFIQPRNIIRFDGGNVEYICDTIQAYDPCIQQHPMLINEMEMEIKNYIFDELEDCFGEMAEKYGARGWEMTFASSLDFDVDLMPGKVVLDVRKEIVIDWEGDKKTFKEFDVEIKSPLYDLAKVALEIAAQEGKPGQCYFENVGYSLTYPRYNIELYNLFPDGTKIFTINDKKSGKFMRIATRSCVVPRGI